MFGMFFCEKEKKIGKDEAVSVVACYDRGFPNGLRATPDVRKKQFLFSLIIEPIIVTLEGGL